MLHATEDMITGCRPWGLTPESAKSYVRRREAVSYAAKHRFRLWFGLWGSRALFPAAWAICEVIRATAPTIWAPWRWFHRDVHDPVCPYVISGCAGVLTKLSARPLRPEPLLGGLVAADVEAP